MKDIFLDDFNNKSLAELTNASTIPNIINFGQYRNAKVINNKQTLGPNGDIITGSLESGEFEFDITLGDANNKDDLLKKVRDIVIEGNHRNLYKVSKKTIKDNYYIIDILDYSQLSMSTYYRDFIPHVYIDGCKVWQKYVDVIKHYTTKKAYILINKENNLSSLPDRESLLDRETNVIIRICYKNAKENYNLMATNYNDKTNDNDNQNIIDKTDNSSYILDGTSFVFDGKFNGDIISDYDFYDDNNNEINKEYIQSVEIEEKGNKKIFSQKNYFRQKFGIDISTNEPNWNGNVSETDFERNVSVKITINLKKLQPDHIYLKSKYNNSIANPSEFELADVEYNYFNSAGKRLSSKPSATNDIEVVPEYSSKRKIVLKINDNATGFQKLSEVLLLFKPIYRSNLINGEILVYDKDGKFLGTKIAEDKNKESNIGTVIIYDNNEEEDKSLINYGESTNFDINRNSTGIQDFKSTNNINKPISTFLLKLDENIDFAPVAYVVARYFPIPLDYYYIAKDLVYYKLPDYFYVPKNLYNKTFNEKNGEYEETKGTDKLNKFILDSIEPKIYFEGNVQPNILILDDTNSIIYDESKNQKAISLGNSNIINYNKRFITEKKIKND